jgi:hypothetical protein
MNLALTTLLLFSLTAAKTAEKPHVADAPRLDDSHVRFLTSGETECCLNEHQFVQAYVWMSEETKDAPVTPPQVLVIHANDFFREFAGRVTRDVQGNPYGVKVNRLSDEDDQGHVTYIVWVFGAGDASLYVHALSAVWQDAYAMTPDEAQAKAERVYEKMLREFPQTASPTLDVRQKQK